MLSVAVGVGDCVGEIDETSTAPGPAVMALTPSHEEAIYSVELHCAKSGPHRSMVMLLTDGSAQVTDVAGVPTPSMVFRLKNDPASSPNTQASTGVPVMVKDV